MRVVTIAAGAAGMYCGSCLHDNGLTAALLELGIDAVLVPTYTPLRTDDENHSTGRVFFGGINVYLQQKSVLFRHTPRWFDRWLDAPQLLNHLAGRAGSVDATQLGALTLSMLRGETGRQRKELDKLVSWLADDLRPDIVHLSNALLSGMAKTLRTRLGVPVVCTLSGEDIFLDKLPPASRDAAYQLICENASAVDAFVALSQYYADLMTDRLELAVDRIEVIPHGLNLDGHDPPCARAKGDPPVIGFLARICHDKGLHLLVEACQRLAADRSVKPFLLRAAGTLGPSNRPYLQAIEHRVDSGPLAGRFEYVGELDRPGKIAFLQSLDLFSIPTVYRESKGLPVLEALANGVPVVLPEHGSFPEIIAATGGGLLCRPHNRADLAAKLAELLADPERARSFGAGGQQMIRKHYHAGRMAESTKNVYHRLLRELPNPG